MIQTAKTTDFLNSVQALRRERSAGLPVWYREHADRNWESFLARGLPTLRDEDFRYTDLATLRGMAVRAAEYRPCSISERIGKYVVPKDITLVLINGQLSREQSQVKLLPPGVQLRPFSASEGNRADGVLVSEGEIRPRIFAQLNESLTADGLILDIPARARIQPLIHILHISDSRPAPALSLPRLLIRLGEQAEASILESHWAVEEQMVYCVDALTDIQAGPGAVLRYCRVQNDSLQAYHLCTTRVHCRQDATVDAFSLNLGSRLTRSDLDVYFAGTGVTATLNGLAFLTGKQHIDTQTFIDHAREGGTSRQLYKNILKDQSRAVFGGKILVRSQAQLTNAYQLNKNLLLGRNCRVDTKPQLEIFADNVKCSHGATIGQLNDDEIFYLRTRGIDRSQAEHMLAQGFVDDIISRIANDSLRQKCEEMLCPFLLTAQGEPICR